MSQNLRPLGTFLSTPIVERAERFSSCSFKYLACALIIAAHAREIAWYEDLAPMEELAGVNCCPGNFKRRTTASEQTSPILARTF